jgi:hypothetical protein
VNRIARKAVKTYLSPPLQKLLEELVGYLGLSESEALRMGLLMMAEKYGLRV